jgi:hypothetical protein
MRIEEFESNLTKRSNGQGGLFKKADFHVHAPGSDDYEYKSPDAIERMGQALAAAEYSYSVIVEHERMPSRELLDRLGKHCPKTKLIPGAEINVYVDVMFKKVAKDHFFHCLVIVDPAQADDYNFVLSKAKDKFLFVKDTNGGGGFHSNILEIGRFFQDSGAIFIPAHLHQSKPPQTSRSIDDIFEDSDFLHFVDAGGFSALEVREASTADFFIGGKTTNDGLPIPLATCVQSSDAHHHAHIAERNRFTWVKTESDDFEELRAALSFVVRSRIQPAASSSSHIIGMHISGQFIADEWILFNTAMNCLIGCKGSGKTSILECLRFVLGTGIPSNRIDEVKNHIVHILGSGGFVECLVCNTSGEKLLFTRRADSPDRLVATHLDGSATEIRDAKQLNFQASLLGWHEIEGVADQPSARMALIDRIGIEDQIRVLYNQISGDVEAAREALPTFQQKLKQLDRQLRQRKALRDKRNTLAKLEKENLTNIQRQYETFLSCEQRLAALTRTVAKVNVESSSALAAYFAIFADDLGKVSDYPQPIQGIVERAKSQHAKIQSVRTRAAEALTADLKGVAEVITELLELAKTEFAKFRTETYDPQVNVLPPGDREILTRQIQILEETKSLPEIENLCNTLGAEVRQLAAGILGSCRKICRERDEICEMRTRIVDRINEQNPTIRVLFQRSADRSARDRYQRTYGVETSALVSYLDSFGKADAYANLCQFFEKYAAFDVEGSDVDIQEMFFDARFIEFLNVVDDDDVQLSLVLPNGKDAPIQKLSAGQRCTTVFPLLLMISSGPLIIDQPEDNLDNRHIADAIAPQFLSRKVSQQFILTSHNANLVVLTDSELIMLVESDGSTGRIAESGFLACPRSKIKEAVLEVLDGGAQALLARKRKYGI